MTLDSDKTHGAIRKARPNNEHKEDELLFEMEGDDLDRVRYKSIDSFRGHHADDSLESLTGERSRESHVTPGLARTETLRIASLNKLRREEFYGSLPQHRKQNINSIGYNFSEPT